MKLFNIQNFTLKIEGVFEILKQKVIYNIAGTMNFCDDMFYAIDIERLTITVWTVGLLNNKGWSGGWKYFSDVVIIQKY